MSVDVSRGTGSRGSGSRGSDSRISFLGATSAERATAATVGAKAANLMRMAAAGLPVPPGFVLGTSVCADYHAHGGRLDRDLKSLMTEGIEYIERAMGRRFGAERRPLLVAVRSGAAVSMPGMLDTIQDVGLCERTLPGLLRATGDPVGVWDSYRRLIQGYAEVVAGCAAAPFAAVLDAAIDRHEVPTLAELDVAALREVVADILDVYRSVAGQPFPQDPMEQLAGAVEAVLRSWQADRAVEYRRLEGLEDLAGTAVTVQGMVFGNMGVTSGAGVGFSRDPATGQSRLYVDFLLNAQGEDVVAGRNSADDPGPLIAAVPGLAHELQLTSRTLESIFGDAQDFEFTVQDGKLWLLQARTAKRTPWAALQIACDMVDEGLIDQETALSRLVGLDLDQVTRSRLAADLTAEPVGRATPASAGVASGQVALTVDTAVTLAQQGEPVILVREQASTDDIAALAVCRGLLTGTGARTSHAAVVARQLGIVCAVNCPDLAIDKGEQRLRIGSCSLHEGDVITIDGADGRIYAGACALVEERPVDLLERVRSWRRASGN